MDDMSIVVVSCDKYSDLWDNFFILKDRYWKDCNVKTYLGSNSKKYNKYDVENISYGEDKSWAENVKNILTKVQSKYVILLLEDFYIDRKVDNDLVVKLLSFAEQNDIDCIRLVPDPGPAIITNRNLKIGKIYPMSPYYISTQPAIWKKDALISLLKDGYSAWDFELKNSVNIKEEEYQIWGSKRYVIHHANAVERGQYYQSVVSFLEKEKLCILEGRKIINDTGIKRKVRLKKYRSTVRIQVMTAYFKFKCNTPKDKNRCSSTGGHRDSNFELLRILCIIGILMMHTFGSIYNSVSGFNLAYGTFLNSLCNTGVSLFVLISGYFGIKSNINKIVSLELTTIFYALLSLAISFFHGETISIKNVIYACFPVSSKLYWFITAYMVMMVFADYINLLPEKLDKQGFQRLIILLLLVFSVLPSFLQMHVMNDSGKGVLNMLLIYLIGRYIRKYDIKIKNEWKAIGVVILVLGIEFALNYCMALIKGGVGVYAPFARDYSIFIVALSVLIFLLVKDIKLSSSFINLLAKNVIGVYLFEGGIRQILGKRLELNAYIGCPYLFVVIMMASLVIFTICSLIEALRRNTIAHIEVPTAKLFSTVIKPVKNIHIGD